MIKTYKRPIYSYGILYKASKNKYSLTQGGDDSIRLSFTYTQEDYPEGFTTYVDNDKPTKLIKKMKQYPYEPVVVKCIIDGGTKFELNGDTYWSSQIGFLSEVGLSYKNFSITFREKQFSKEDEKINKILQEQLRREYIRNSAGLTANGGYTASLIKELNPKRDDDLYHGDRKLKRQVYKQRLKNIKYNFFSDREDKEINKILQEQLRRDYLRSVSPEKPTRLNKVEKIISRKPDKEDQDLYKNNDNLRKKVLKKKFDYILYNFKPKK